MKALRRFVLQVVVDTLAIVSALLVLRLFSVPDPFPFGTTSVPIMQVEDGRLVYLILSGLGLTVGNIVIRPVLVAFTGRLLLWSMGLFSIVITALVLYLTNIFLPLEVAIASPAWLWLFVGAAIVQLIGSFLSAILGLTRPTITPSGTSTGLWGALDALPTPRRNAIIENLRLQQVYDTLIRFGVEITVDRTPLRTVRLWSERYLLGQETRSRG